MPENKPEIPKKPCSDRGFAGKWSHYEQSRRVPRIIHDPRQPKAQRGRVVDPMALNIT